MALSRFPETFRFYLSRHTKREFPFAFNLVQHQNCIAPMPNIDFIAWHKKLVEQDYITKLFDF